MIPRQSEGVSARTMVSECLIESGEFSTVFAGWYDVIRAAIEADATEESDGKVHPWALVGIKRRGAVLARRVYDQLQGANLAPLYGEVDISLYRDDYHLQVGHARVLGTEIPFAVDGLRILLVDDVLYTGRTVRAAIDQLLDFGRPRVIQLAAFIDLGHRELPIAANIVGKTILTRPDDRVQVNLAELGGQDGVDLIRTSA